MRGIITEKARGRRVKAHHVAQQAEGLKGRLGVRMNLGGRHVERSKDAHRELIKGKRHMQV